MKRSLDVLEQMLTENQIPHGTLMLRETIEYGFDAIRIPLAKKRMISVVQHRDSLGFKRNLLEMGVFRGHKIVSSEGWLTADEAFKKVVAVYEQEAVHDVV